MSNRKTNHKASDEFKETVLLGMVKLRSVGELARDREISFNALDCSETHSGYNQKHKTVQEFFTQLGTYELPNKYNIFNYMLRTDFRKAYSNSWGDYFNSIKKDAYATFFVGDSRYFRQAAVIYVIHFLQVATFAFLHGEIPLPYSLL